MYLQTWTPLLVSFSCTSSVVSPAQLQLPVGFLLTEEYSSSYSFPVAVSRSCLPFLVYVDMWCVHVYTCVGAHACVRVCVEGWRNVSRLKIHFFPCLPLPVSTSFIEAGSRLHC